jgi:hypothetical protein
MDYPSFTACPERRGRCVVYLIFNDSLNYIAFSGLMVSNTEYMEGWHCLVQTIESAYAVDYPACLNMLIENKGNGLFLRWYLLPIRGQILYDMRRSMSNLKHYKE